MNDRAVAHDRWLSWQCCCTYLFGCIAYSRPRFGGTATIDGCTAIRPGLVHCWSRQIPINLFSLVKCATATQLALTSSWPRSSGANCKIQSEEHFVMPWLRIRHLTIRARSKPGKPPLKADICVSFPDCLHDIYGGCLSALSSRAEPVRSVGAPPIPFGGR